MPHHGPQFLPSLIAAPCCERWRSVIDAAVDRCLARGADADFSRSSSSLRLRAFRGESTGIDLDALVGQVWRDPLRALVRAWLGPQVALLADQCWARRQFAPGAYPAGHAPHEWHQDGALHFDFVAPYPADALLRMLTCWIALTPCGDDAPGLELVRDPLPGLLAPGDLAAGQIAARFGSAAFWRPVFAPGDAIVFSGGSLHRTHVEPAMHRGRTSLELRFVAADEQIARLRDERLVPMPDPQGTALASLL